MTIDWVPLATLVFVVINAIAGTVAYYYRATAADLKELEEQSERRHLETVQRLVRLETLVIKTSNGRPPDYQSQGRN
jgi:hypothetical protein